MDSITKIRKVWTEEQRLAGQLRKAKKWNCKADLTMKQWNETLEYFGRSCAYCGGKYQVIEHYIPMARDGGTTVSNCVPACFRCNTRKDAQSKQCMYVYNNQRVIDFLTSRGAVISIHIHDLKVKESPYIGIVDVCCDCGYHYSIIGKWKDAQESAEEEQGMYGEVTAL